MAIGKKKIKRSFSDDHILQKKRGATYQDNFELLYLRYRYFVQADNPTTERLKSFDRTIKYISGTMYRQYSEIFKVIGMELEDIESICLCLSVSYISLYGLEENEDRMESFIKQHKKQYGEHSLPTKHEVFKKDSYDLQNFVVQRMQQNVKAFNSKASCIRGTKDYVVHYIGNSDTNPDDLELYHNHEAYNYEKITHKKYNEILKKHKPQDKNLFIDTDTGNVVRTIYIKGSILTRGDLEERDVLGTTSLLYRDPEELAMLAEAI